MKIIEKKPARTFEAGFEQKVTLYDCGTVELEPNEQVTFLTAEGGEYDVARKEWGFYATPSTNGRLTRFGLRAALVKNREERTYVVLVEKEKQDLFDRYCASERLQVVAWLDSDEAARQLKQKA